MFTKANIADLPSRKDFKLLNELGSIEKDVVLPSLVSFDDNAAMWITTGQDRTPGTTRNRAVPQGDVPERRRRRRR